MKQFFKSRAFLYAVLLHLAIIFLVFFSVHFSSTPMSAASAPSENPTKIVEAVAVNQAAVQQEVQKIQQERAAKAQQALDQQRQLQQQQAALKQQQQVAAKAKAALAAQQTALRQQQAAIAKAQQQQAAKAAAVAAQQQATQQAEAKAAAAAAAQQQANQQAAQQALQQKLQQDQADTQAAAQAAKATAAAQQQAAQLAGTVNKYNALILAAIHPNWIISDKQKDLSTDVLISLAPDGSVLSVQVQKSSGSTAFDNSAVAAVYKSSPLPVPSDPQAFAVFRQFKLTLHPEG